MTSQVVIQSKQIEDRIHVLDQALVQASKTHIEAHMFDSNKNFHSQQIVYES